MHFVRCSSYSIPHTVPPRALVQLLRLVENRILFHEYYFTGLTACQCAMFSVYARLLVCTTSVSPYVCFLNVEAKPRPCVLSARICGAAHGWAIAQKATGGLFQQRLATEHKLCCWTYDCWPWQVRPVDYSCINYRKDNQRLSRRYVTPVDTSMLAPRNLDFCYSKSRTVTLFRVV